MFAVRFRRLWPLLGVALAVGVPMALGWSLWVAVVLAPPALWLSHLLLTWLAIATLRATMPPGAAALVPDLASIGVAPSVPAPASPGGRVPRGSQFLALRAFGPKTALVIAFVETLSRLDSATWAKLARGIILDEDLGEGPLQAAEARLSSFGHLAAVQARRWVEQEVSGQLLEQPDKSFEVFVAEKGRKTPADGLRAGVRLTAGRAAAALVLLDQLDIDDFADLYVSWAAVAPIDTLLARATELDSTAGPAPANLPDISAKAVKNHFGESPDLLRVSGGAVACPTCQTPAGVLCRDQMGVFTIHPQRIEAAKAS